MIQISVIGPSQPSQKEYELAYKIGEIIGRKGYVLITGGRSGIMEAASCGTKSKGGITVGILPRDTQEANPCVDIKIPTFMNELRNFLVVSAARVVVSVGISDGTLIELAIANKLNKPVISFLLPDKLHFLSTHMLTESDINTFEKLIEDYAQERDTGITP